MYTPPIVLSWYSWNCPLTKRSTRLDLPTADSPRRTSLNWQTRVCVFAVPLARCCWLAVRAAIYTHRQCRCRHNTETQRKDAPDASTISLQYPHTHCDHPQAQDRHILSTNRSSARTSTAFVAAPSTWNSPPADIRLCENILTFKHHLKTHLFKLT